MKRKQLLLLLALLMTAATGAWAQSAKHVITATYREQTRSLEQPLPYETTVGALYEAVTGQSFSYFISQLSAAYQLTLTGISSNDASVVSIGDFNDASTKVTVNADGKATVALRFGNFAQGIYVSVVPPLYVTMADGTKDAAKWTATVGEGDAKTLPVGKLSKGNAVTLTYGGRLKVKNVTATHDGWNGDLSNIPASALEADGKTVIVPDGTTLTGTLNGETQPYKITIADGATVTLGGVTINGVNNGKCQWAGLNCQGKATIVLKDGTTNTVKGFHENYPGIHVPMFSKLTIQGGTEGTGKLTASPFDGGTGDSYGAGFGGGNSTPCGDIDIQGGIITATGGSNAAGIGGGKAATCSNISITGGTVTATGGYKAAGIGGGRDGSCGNITITDDVTLVTATKGAEAPYSIGMGYNDVPGTCGTVTIGGTVYWQDNAAVGDGATYLGQATIVYPAPAVTWNTVDLSTLTADYEAQDGDKLTGTLSGSKKISIADGATVMLDGAVINGTNSSKWAGLTLAGDGTIILSGENSVKGFYEDYPGIFVPVNKTLTIQGDGSLNASSNGYGAGIGGGYEIACGNITIEGGTVTATGGRYAAGIGGGSSTSCGAITITGGTVTASGGQSSPGIGSGSSTSCGAVTIANTVTSVTASKGENATISIGPSYNGSCGTVTIGGTKYWENNAAVNGGNSYLATSPLIYEPSH